MTPPGPYYLSEDAVLWRGVGFDVLPFVAPGTIAAFLLDEAATTSLGRANVARYIDKAPQILRPGGIVAIAAPWGHVTALSADLEAAGLQLVAWIQPPGDVNGPFGAARHPVVIAANGRRPVVSNGTGASTGGKRRAGDPDQEVWEQLLRQVPAGVVFDGHAHDGASAVAALNAGHTWVGVESDERQCEAIVKRLEARGHQGQLDLAPMRLDA